MKKYTYSDYTNAAELIKAKIKDIPQTAIVLGSGLGQLADAIESPVILDYHDIPGWSVSTVSGHKGRLVIGTLCGKTVLAQQGRVHFYEGYTSEEITFPVRVMASLGIKNLVVTNAAGGINPAFSAGDVMLITDHINLVGMVGFNPLIGPNLEEFGTRFPDMTQAYDRDFCEMARKAAQKNGIVLREGVYTWLSGPSYETPAEVRFMRIIGSDAVGMSTVPEVVVARHSGIRVLGFSGITNKCSDNGIGQTTHQEVLDSAEIIGPKVISILHEVLPQM